MPSKGDASCGYPSAAEPLRLALQLQAEILRYSLVLLGWRWLKCKQRLEFAFYNSTLDVNVFALGAKQHRVSKGALKRATGTSFASRLGLPRQHGRIQASFWGMPLTHMSDSPPGT